MTWGSCQISPHSPKYEVSEAIIGAWQPTSHRNVLVFLNILHICLGLFKDGNFWSDTPLFPVLWPKTPPPPTHLLAVSCPKHLKVVHLIQRRLWAPPFLLVEEMTFSQSGKKWLYKFVVTDLLQFPLHKPTIKHDKLLCDVWTATSDFTDGGIWRHVTHII